MNGAELLEGLPHPAAVLSPHEGFVAANRRFARFFACPAGDMAGLTAAIAAAPGLDTALREAVLTVTTERRSAEFHWVAPGPDPEPYVGHASLAGGDYIVVVLEHVSEQIASEKIFSVVREYLDGVLNHLPIGVIVLDGDRRVTFYNRKQAELFAALGLEQSLLDVIGAPITDVYPVFAGGYWITLVDTVMKRRESGGRNRVPFPPAEPRHHLRVQVVPLLGRQGDVSGTVCVTEDVTRLVQLEHNVVRQERLAVAGQIVAKFHHEINNPLVSILGMAEMLLYHGVLDPDVSRRVERIRRGALRIAEVTKKMREIRELGKEEWPGELPTLPDLSIRPTVTP